jgi:hypothetical protein
MGMGCVVTIEINSDIVPLINGHSRNDPLHLFACFLFFKARASPSQATYVASTVAL